MLLGHPVAHSLSPVFQNAALAAAGIDLTYVAQDVAPEHLADVVAGLGRTRAAGNVTLPHKPAMRALCTHLTHVAERAGAVNTFWHDEQGVLHGDNTDVVGVHAAIKAIVPADRVLRKITLLGAGGAAAGAIVALDAWPAAEVACFTRTPLRGARLGKRAGRFLHMPTDLAEAVDGSDLVINATPVGLTTDEMPVPPELLPDECCVLDMVYRRGETAWVQACRTRGHRAEDGLRMLVEQGAAAFRIWFAVEPERASMWRVLEARSATGASEGDA